jgi:O-antigen/teichoic acid export membrane protein
MDENAKLFGIVNILNSTLGAGLTLLFVIYLKMGWQGRIFSLFIGTSLAAALSLYYSIKYIRQFEKPKLKMFKSMFVFGLPLLPHQLAVWIKTGFEKFFITASLGLGQNGVYSFAITICAIFVMVSNAFFSAFSPYVYKTLSEIQDSSNEYQIKLNIVKKSYLFLIVYMLVLVIGGIASYIFINYFFKEKYGESIIYLPFLLGFNFFNSCYIVLSMFVYYSKSTKYLGVITISTSMLQVFLMIYLVGFMGSLGAALAAFATSIVTMITVYIYSNKVYKMPWFNFADIFGSKNL